MPSSKSLAGLEHFSRLSNSVYIHEPTTTNSSSKHPDLILICAWMGASPRHISKYTTSYEKLYPSARILAITTSSFDATLASHSANVKRIEPVLEILYTLPANTKLLLHFFSNGGSITSLLITRKYLEEMGRPIPIAAVILDSTPGKVTYEATIRAFSVGLPKNPILNAIGIVILRLFYGLFRLFYLLTRKRNLVEQAWIDLNIRSLMDIDTPRLYIYSTADNMIAWQFVEEHIEEAKKLGYKVDRERFTASGHCAHILSDEKRYLDALQRLWSTI